MATKVLVAYATRYGSTQDELLLRDLFLEVEVHPANEVRTLDGNARSCSVQRSTLVAGTKMRAWADKLAEMFQPTSQEVSGLTQVG